MQCHVLRGDVKVHHLQSAYPLTHHNQYCYSKHGSKSDSNTQRSKHVHSIQRCFGKGESFGGLGFRNELYMNMLSDAKAI